MDEIEIEYDEAKRLKILAERGLDLADAVKVFAAPHVQLEDDRKDYGEARYRVWGVLDDRPVNLVWTPREERRRIITMRHAHGPEHKARQQTLD